MEISVNELLRLNNPNIIDIRSNQKYNDNHIPGSVNISYDALTNNPSNFLEKNYTYYIYCQKGITSKTVCQILRALGYNVISVIGGYEAYLFNSLKKY